MPYAVKDICYSTTAEAVEAFAKQFPIIGDVNIQSFGTATISATGLITYSIKQKAVTTNAINDRPGTMQLASCTVPDVVKLDTANAFYAFSWGFGVVALFWFFGYWMKNGKQAIKFI